MKKVVKFLTMMFAVAMLIASCKDSDEPVAVSSVTVDASLSLAVGEQQTLVATVSPEDAADKTVTWSSDNEDVATVDASGVVTAVSAGTATITATTADGSKTAVCEVTVSGNDENEGDEESES